MNAERMHACNPSELPAGYREQFTINLQKDKKLALIINGAAFAIMLVLGILGHLAVPVTSLFSMEQGFGIYFLRIGALIVGYVVYMILHELVHGICMKAFSGVKPRYGFTGMYAYAGSDCYFAKPYYIMIALAPVVVWGIVLQVLCAVVPEDWFWVVYFIQIGNLAGAAGDFYVTWRFRQLPGNILVRDTGIEMTVYGKE